MIKLRTNQSKFRDTHEIKFNSIQYHVKDFENKCCRMNTRLESSFERAEMPFLHKTLQRPIKGKGARLREDTYKGN